MWIPLSDGTRLAGRIWLPEDAWEQPVPAVLEYIPYRKDDGTALGDSMNHPYFAGHGYASIRVDLRGSGDSDGLLLDEYLPQEQLDALEVIAWIAAQPWCSGKVGMMGISWGGFNSLQVAAHRPPALKAIITVCSTDDRYTDDCHYMGGCVLGSDMLNWASYMFAYNALPPDPQVVGERWREMWLGRMENTPPFVQTWLSHQWRDDYWKQGSVDEDYSAIECAVYAVGGWTDPYTNAVPRLLQHLKAPRKGLIGPWVHAYPHRAVPEPSIGFLQECLRWWDYWLKGVDTGIMDEAMLRVWMPQAIPPQAREEVWLGRWVAERGWPPEGIEPLKLAFADGKLEEQPGVEQMLTIAGAQVNGATAGVWCPYNGPFGLPVDQRPDDGLSLTFTSAPALQAIDILGFPEVQLKLAVDQDQALLAVRLCDVAPEGYSRLVSWGLLNLTHRDGHDRPEPLVPGQVYTVGVQLNAAAHTLQAGHRWRVAVSPTYWPHAWPSRRAATLTLFIGQDSFILLPVRPPKAMDEKHEPFPEPEGAPLIEAYAERHDSGRRSLHYNPASGELTMLDEIDEGRTHFAASGLTWDARNSNLYAITEGLPLSARVECRREIEISRGEWKTRVKTFSEMSSDQDFFHLTNLLDAYEGEAKVFSKSWTVKIPRKLV